MDRGRLLALAFVLTLVGARPAGALGIPPVPIPAGPGGGGAPAFIGHAATANPLTTFAIPRHPFMAPNGASNLHADAYQTDTYAAPGPLGRSMDVRSTFHVADCASVTFDSHGRIVGVCVGLDGPRLVLMDPETLKLLSAFPLPPRQPSASTTPFQDFSGGGYFYLDQADRAVVPTTNHQIWVIGQKETALGTRFGLRRIYDLSPLVRARDSIVSALPDWSGRYWFVTSKGEVGTVDPATGALAGMRLWGEAIENSIAVDETGGVFVVSDHALYRFVAGPGGAPVISWRVTYDRGTRVKPGQVSHGSGTTPTLIGDGVNGTVAIADNADPRMHVLVYRRGATVSGSRLVCAEPVFADGMSDTDQSLVAFGSSLIVENNYGYTGPAATFHGTATQPGLTRVDVDSGGCHTVWESAERAPSVVPKVSLANGLVYTYTKDPDAGGSDLWYFTAIDARTGATVFKRLAGRDLGFNNNYAPVTIGTNGRAYVGVLGGLVRLEDTA